jgi:hypothetical protein
VGLYAYCLMGNHYHLLIETPEGNLVAGMRRLNGAYTQSFNRRHDRVGHLFQGRYQGILVDKDSYLLELSRYIVLNPVRAALVEGAADWPWSSYRAMVGAVEAPAWLRCKALLGLFADAAQTYQPFVVEGMGAPSPWDALRGQIWLGSEVFRARMEALLQGKSLTQVPVQQTRPTRPTAQEVKQAVARAYGVARGAVLECSNRAVFQATVHLLRRAANLSLREVSELAGISASRISQIQRMIETEGADGRVAESIAN